jgi:hypothetical protein
VGVLRGLVRAACESLKLDQAIQSPIVDVRPAVPLPIHNPARARGVAETTVGREHAPGDVEQSQILDIAGAPEELAFENGGRGRGGRRAHQRRQHQRRFEEPGCFHSQPSSVSDLDRPTRR